MDTSSKVSSSDERNVDSSTSRQSISGLFKTQSDDKLIGLTKNEELVYRKTLKARLWEEEQRRSEEEYESSFEDTTDSENESAAAILWQRVGAPAQAQGGPYISVNDRRVSFTHVAGPSAGESQITTSVAETDESNDTFSSVFPGGKQDDSDSDPVQTIMDLLDEVSRGQKETAETEQKGKENRNKLWKRRLIVILLLNFLMRFRRKFLLLSELVLPVIITLSIVFGMIANSESFATAKRSSSTSADVQTNDSYAAIKVEAILSSYCANADLCEKKSDRHYYIVYSPKTKFTDDLMDRVLDFLEIKTQPHAGKKRYSQSEASRLIGVASPVEVAELCNKHWSIYDVTKKETPYGPPAISPPSKTLIRYPMGIIFSFEEGLLTPSQLEAIGNDTDLPKRLSYTIRTHYSEVSNTVEGFPFREIHTYQKNSYLFTGIVGVQLAIDLAFAEKIVEKSTKDGNIIMQFGETNPTYVERAQFFRQFLEEPVLQPFLHPTYKGLEQRVRGWVSLTMTIMFGFMISDLALAQETIQDQQRGSIELLKIHGMTTAMRWIANLFFVILLRSATIFPISYTINYLMAAGTVSEFVSPLSFYSFLLAYSVCGTCFNLFITTGFGIKKMELAGMIVVVVSFLAVLFPLHLFEQGLLSRNINYFLCLIFPQWNLANGIYYYLRYEIYEEGMSWFDFPVIVDSDAHRIMALPVGGIFFVYSTFLYMFLTIYMDHILPREFSPKESWLFFFEMMTRKPPSQSKATRPISKSQKPSVYERGPKDSYYGPRFRNLTLTEGTDKATVMDNISFDVYEGEVTCIVGQTGSGKSELLNAIAGVCIPSAGFVDVKGLRVQEYHDVTNRFVSLCPQKALLIESLSVEDHIRLCCMLHGSSYGKARTQAAFLMNMFGLSPMRRHNFKGLTKSDTKKLMIAMALSKSPSVLLLDNPIDQLDAESTVKFWMLLQELKQHRSIIVTCTKLEEAQLYGDRIAVLCRGKLMCYGTPAYLKLAFGLGSIINISQKGNASGNIKAIEKVLEDELNGAQPRLMTTKFNARQFSTDHEFIIPYGKFLAHVIEKLEDNMESLDISKISISQPSLLALYFTIANHSGIERVLARKEVQMMRGVDQDENLDLEKATLPPIPSKSENSKVTMLGTISILVKKKIWYYRQKYWTFLLAYICQIILVMQVAYFARLFLVHEPEGIAKVISTRLYENNYILVRSADNEHTRKTWEQAFKTVLYDDNHNVTIQYLSHGENLAEYLKAWSVHSFTNYKKQMVVAFSRDTSGHTGYFSVSSIHSSAIASHTMTQAFLYVISPDRDSPYSTVFNTYPFLQYTGYAGTSTQSSSCTILGLFLAVVLSLLSAPALRMVLTEKNTRFKMVQRMAGVPSFIYWFTHGIGDIIMYAGLTALCFGLVVLIDRLQFRQLGFTELVTLLYIFILWLCWAAVPYTYFVSMVVPTRLTGYGPYMVLVFALGIIPKVVTYQFLRLYIDEVTTALRYILYIFPPYSITSACVHYFHVVGHEKWCAKADNETCELYGSVRKQMEQSGNDSFFRGNFSSAKFTLLRYKIQYDDVFRTCCKEFCEIAGTCHKEPTLFPALNGSVIPGLRHDTVALVANGLIFWALVILTEKGIIRSMYQFIASKLCGNLEQKVALRDVRSGEEPEDVKNEHIKVDFMVEIEGDVDSEVYLVQDVTKFFAYTKGLDHVYFSVPINTITGVLGLPKTGKSTLAEVLTTQLTPSSGFIYKDNDYLNGKSRKTLLLDTGYCPQTPCVLPYLTAWQMLTIVGKLRGLSNVECIQHVNWWLQIFGKGNYKPALISHLMGLQETAGIKCVELKRGQVKRLSVAMALIGDTRVIILDEPSEQLDNLERYIFWNAISRMSETTFQRTILFTTTSAEEVQQQASKVVVLDAGAVIAVGNLSEIFKNTNQGMVLAIRYKISQYKEYTEYQKSAKLDKLKDHVIQYLSPCALMDEQESVLIYHLKDATLKLSRVYGVMEGAKMRFPFLLEHFQVFEQSLDDIVLELHKAKTKRENTLANINALQLEQSTAMEDPNS